MYAPYFKALAATGAAIDALAFHWYPSTLSASGLDYTWSAMRRVAVLNGLGELPIWVTEVGFETQAKKSSSATVAAVVPQTLAMAKSLGIARVYFYAWSDLPIGNFISLHTGSVLERGLLGLPSLAP
ncbi:MAG: glycosyl hydrolase [Candidatus Nanopelagicales bacterium]|nr:glycosyl hydrolase [Candidatus Nanopelagicales bacterium]